VQTLFKKLLIIFKKNGGHMDLTLTELIDIRIILVLVGIYVLIRAFDFEPDFDKKSFPYLGDEIYEKFLFYYMTSVGIVAAWHGAIFLEILELDTLTVSLMFLYLYEFIKGFCGVYFKEEKETLLDNHLIDDDSD
jgi:hypothetical protein